MLAFSTDAEALSLPTPTEGTGHEPDSRGHGDWIEVTRLASDCRISLHPIIEAPMSFYSQCGDWRFESSPLISYSRKAAPLSRHIGALE